MLVFVVISFLLCLVFYYKDYNKAEFDNQIEEKNSLIQGLEQEKLELQNNITKLKKRFEEIESFCQNISTSEELKNPSWNELKIFLETDQTNKLIYNRTFDCLGFGVELFKRARNSGLRCAIVEIEFEENTTSHVLNAFQTADKSLVFVDATGNENGTGKDRIGYIKIREPYGTAELSVIKENMISCDVDCNQFAKQVSYVNYTDFFGYSYFLELKKCKEFYEDCIDLYNNAVKEYNKGERKYSYSELQSWRQNLEALEEDISGDGFYSVSEWEGTVKNIEIYW